MRAGSGMPVRFSCSGVPSPAIITATLADWAADLKFSNRTLDAINDLANCKNLADPMELTRSGSRCTVKHARPEGLH
jgi:hypothetical protein